jgi:hypothetical protein
MADFGKALSNPTVLMAGAAIGLVILLIPKSSAAANPATPAIVPGIYNTPAADNTVPMASIAAGLAATQSTNETQLSLGQMGSTTQQNADALNFTLGVASIAGNNAVNALNGRVAEHTAAYSAMTNILTAQDTVANAYAVAGAGVVQSITQSSSAYATEAASANSRTLLGAFAGNAQFETAKQTAFATVETAKQQAKSSLFSSIASAVGSVAKVGAAVATGGASVVPSLFAGMPVGGGNNSYYNA